MKRMSYKNALIVAANEAYQNEVVDTGMEAIEIGDDGPYKDKKDWIDCKITSWIIIDDKDDGLPF